MVCKVTYDDILRDLTDQQEREGQEEGGTPGTVVTETVDVQVDESGNPIQEPPVNILIPNISPGFEISTDVVGEPIGDLEDPFSDDPLPSATEQFKNFLKETKTETAIAVGRKMRVVPQTEFGSEKEVFENNSNPSKNPDFFVNDLVRARLGNYWSINRESETLSYISQDTNASPFVVRSYANEGVSNTATNSGFGRTEQTVVLQRKPRFFANALRTETREIWRNYIAGGPYEGSISDTDNANIQFNSTVLTSVDAEFSDHLHDMSLPFSQKELDMLNNPMRSLVADVKPEYNYYLKSFENKINEPAVLENTLPNIYAFLSQQDSENPNPEFNNLITLENTIDTQQEILKTGKIKNTSGTRIDNLPVGRYLETYARRYDEPDLSRLNQKFSNILLSDKDFSLIKEYNEKREMFPMYVDIKFSTDKTTTIAQALKDTKLSNLFVTQVANRLISEENPTFLDCVQSIETNVQESPSSNLKRRVSITQQNKRIWDITTLIQQLGSSNEMLNGDSAIYLGDYQNQIDTMGTENSVFIKNLMSTIFIEKLRKIVKDKFRTYQQVMEGVPAYSETVLYRVAKFEGGPNGTPIQNYYFPNSNEIDVLRFIDTQVKYEKQYSYVVYAYQFVIGNKYQYRNLTVPVSGETASFKVYNEPSLVLFEHQFYSFTGKIIDDPPIPPDVNIVPYKGIDDKILIMMNSAVGNFVTDPVILNESEESIIDEIRAEKQLGPRDPIRFKVDDYVNTFEIYRTEVVPKSYLDFQGQFRGLVRTDVDLNSKQSATSAAFVDTIEPNKKYYYIFRSIDNHNNFSNPTPIIRIEMVNENGSIFMLKDTVDFAQEKRETSKSAKRFIQLVPNVLQASINEEASGFDKVNTAFETKDKIVLGISDEPLWGKTFKIRLTSKSTGKKMDFRVKFEHEHKEKA